MDENGNFSTQMLMDTVMNDLIKTLNGAFYRNKKVVCKHDGGSAKKAPRRSNTPDSSRRKSPKEVTEGSARRRPKKK